jgi:predicted Zn-dependent peptidase
VLTAVVKPPVGAAGAAAASALPVEELRLDNGMRFLMLRRPHMPTVEAGWVVDIGAAGDEAGATGLSHLVEHMMFKGTRTIGSRDLGRELATLDRLDAVEAELAALPDDGRRSARRRSELNRQRQELERRADAAVQLGAFGLEYSRAGATRLNANTTLDSTLYYVTLPAEKLELWFWLESNRLSEPVFRELGKEKRVVAEERRLRVESTPTGAADRAFDEAFWRATPYARSTLGDPADVEAADRPAVRAFFDRHYRPERLTAVLIGNFEPAAARRLAATYFGRLAPGAGPPPGAPIRPPRTSSEVFATVCNCPPQVHVRYPTVALGHPDNDALQTLSALLNGRAGRLYRRLVLGREIAFAAYAQQSALARGGSFTVSLEAKGGAALETLLAAWDEELTLLLAAPPAEEEVRRTRRRLATEHLDQLKDPHSLLRRLLIYAGLGDWRHLAGWTERLAAVAPGDVQRAARRYLTADRRLVGYYRRGAE